MTRRPGGSDGVYVLGFARTPFGKFGGGLREAALPELAAVAVSEALKRSTITPADVDELVLGVNFSAQERSVARQVQLRAGIPNDRVAYTVDRACCSSATAINLACRSILLGTAGIAIAGGAENLSRVPYFLSDMRWGTRLGNVTLVDSLVISCPYTGVPRAIQASQEASRYGIGRLEQDEWALRSQQRYAEAKSIGFFANETVPVAVRPGATGMVVEDEAPRPDTTLEGLASLPTINGSETVTAGNAPDLSSGASSLVLASGAIVRERRLTAAARIVGRAAASGAPEEMASNAAKAARLALADAELDLSDVDVLEVNEAFAAVPLVVTALLTDDPARLSRLRDRTNVNGGAIAIGHPTGASGGRLAMTMISELQRRGGGTGLMTICGGIGEAEALVLTVPTARTTRTAPKT
jgi:acetyl-CoA C-acetyltransferase